MTDHLDALEARDPAEREASQFECLRHQLGQGGAPALVEQMADHDPSAVVDRAALARLPLMRKSRLMERQKADPPLGGLAAHPVAEFDHLFQSPGPIYEPGMTRIADWWRMARALNAAGIGAGDRVLNCFSQHLVPAGVMLASGARALGALTIPGGVGQAEAQAAIAADCGATAYVGTPDFLKVVLEKADETGRDLRALTRAWVSGGALFPSLRAAYAERGIACLQGYATADCGSIAFETTADGAVCDGMVVDEGVILEIVRPGTGDPVPDGEVGEVVVTLLNAEWPLLRFATGDLSAILPGLSPCGRTGPRIRGWMGRADQTTKVRGMFVRPEQIADIVERHSEVAKARAVVSREGEADTLRLVVETESAPEGVAETARAVLGLRAEIETTLPGTLPNDGKVIEDTRDYG